MSHDEAAANLRSASTLIGRGLAQSTNGRAADLVRQVRLGDKVMRLNVYGTDQARHLAGVFRHLEAAPAAKVPDLDVVLAEAVAEARDVLEALAAPRPGMVEVRPGGSGLIERHVGLAIALDQASGRLAALAGPFERMPPSHLSHPLAHMIGAISEADGGFVTHGAVVGRDGWGILLPGCGGQGKSTSALACAQAGWDFVGDDFMLLAPAPGGGFIAHALYATGRIHPAQAARFPGLVAGFDHVMSAEDRKLTLFPRAGTLRLVPRLRIAALVLPQVDEAQGARIGPLSRSAALRALITDSVRIHPGLTRARVQFYGEAVAALPCRTLHASPDLAAIPGALGELLEQMVPTPAMA